MKTVFRTALLGLATLVIATASGVALAAPQPLRINLTDSDGNPIPKENIRRFHCRDMSDEPIVTRVTLKNGQAVIELPAEPIQVCTLFVVPGFGEVDVYADNSGKGFSTANTVDFVAEAAKTRRERVIKAVKEAKRELCPIPSAVEKAISESEKLEPYPALARLLTAGEEMTLARARYRISRYDGPRQGFLFGANAFGYPGRGPEYERRFKELFNYGTANLYLTDYAPSPDKRNFSLADAQVEWLRSNAMAAKTCPPLYFARSVSPEWMKNKQWAQTEKTCHDLMLEVTERYKGRVVTCEIVNEAHDLSNGLNLTQDQLVRLADVSARAVREADPNVLRVINCTHLWADYASRLTSAGLKRRSPYRYLKECIDAGVKFEIVGLQMYYPQFDLLEIDRMLERYASLGKPIHITEMACSSAPGLDPNAQRQAATAGWHGPWTEDMQADWIVAAYTLFYSKPYIGAVSYWDLPDIGCFWPYGGMLRGDLSPKPSYTRLQSLIRSWGYHYLDPKKSTSTPAQ